MKDNFNKLVELSDKSFSSSGFVSNFERENEASFEFDLTPNDQIKSLTFAFSLNRPEARGGAENLTLNILAHKEIYPLLNQFTGELRGNVHRIHVMLDEQVQQDLLLKAVKTLRIKISKIVKAYKELYGSTELLEEYEN